LLALCKSLAGDVFLCKPLLIDALISRTGEHFEKPAQEPQRKMPRLKAAVQARKETALEALRDALRETGRLIRPRLGCPGYGAVRVALLHWRPDFDELSYWERKALSRAATHWDTERNDKPGPHARVDVERHASLTRELVKLLEAPEAAAKAASAAAQPGTARQASMRKARAAQAVSVSPDPPAAERPRDEESTGDERSAEPQKPFAEALGALPPPSANLEEAAQLLEKTRQGDLVNAFDELGDKPPALLSFKTNRRLRSAEVPRSVFCSFSQSLAGANVTRYGIDTRGVLHVLFGGRGQFDRRTLALLLRVAERSRDAAVISARDRHRQNSYLPAIPGYAADVVLESLAADVDALDLAIFASELADWLGLMEDVNREIEAGARDLRELARLRVVQAVASAFYILVFFIPGRAVGRKYRLIDLRQGDVKLMFARLRSMSIDELAGLSTNANLHKTPTPRKQRTPREPRTPRKPPTPREPVEEVRGGQRLNKKALARLKKTYAREQAAEAASKPAAKKRRV
jgi:hypothetical protein